jgi:hypothetical protein
MRIEQSAKAVDEGHRPDAGIGTRRRAGAAQYLFHDVQENAQRQGLDRRIVLRSLVWYLATLSKASVVYGSLTTAVVVLFSFELAATLLLGAQVIAEYEKLEERVGR